MPNLLHFMGWMLLLFCLAASGCFCFHSIHFPQHQHWSILWIQIEEKTTQSTPPTNTISIHMNTNLYIWKQKIQKPQASDPEATSLHDNMPMKTTPLACHGRRNAYIFLFTFFSLLFWFLCPLISIWWINFHL